MPVRIQKEDFDVSIEIARLREGNPKVGAVASFVGNWNQRFVSKKAVRALWGVAFVGGTSYRRFPAAVSL